MFCVIGRLRLQSFEETCNYLNWNCLCCGIFKENPNLSDFKFHTRVVRKRVCEVS
ncbi:hypothetical protein LINPERHAP1_LOCUS15755 [Linum perenne]